MEARRADPKVTFVDIGYRSSGPDDPETASVPKTGKVASILIEIETVSASYTFGLGRQPPAEL